MILAGNSPLGSELTHQAVFSPRPMSFAMSDDTSVAQGIVSMGLVFFPVPGLGFVVRCVLAARSSLAIANPGLM